MGVKGLNERQGSERRICRRRLPVAGAPAVEKKGKEREESRSPISGRRKTRKKESGGS